VPMFLKRTIFFDFEKYEYKPTEESKTKTEWVRFIYYQECRKINSFSLVCHNLLTAEKRNLWISVNN
jgi:hypothetical protein